MFFLFQMPRYLLQRTPLEAKVSLFQTLSETDVFPFSDTEVFASKDTIGH